MSRKGKKRRGCFCWACDRHLPSERFSGKGRGRHLCKCCSRLGADHVGYLQAMRNLDRASHNGYGIRRGQRGVVERYLAHDNPKVRALALYLFCNDERRRLKRRLKGEMVSLLQSLEAQGLYVVKTWSNWDDEWDFDPYEYEDAETAWEGPCDGDGETIPF